MKKSIVLFSIAAMVLAAFSCKKNTDSTTPVTTVTVNLPAKEYSYYSDTTGMVSTTLVDSMNKIATLGRVLFYDAHLSVNNSVSCGSCHKQQFAFSDNTALSMGFQFMPTKRNSPPIQDLNPNALRDMQFQSNMRIFVLFWDGRENSIPNLITRPISNHVEMGIADLTTLPAKIAGLSYYPSLFTKAYGSSEVTVDKISQAVATFISSINSTGARFNENDPNTLNNLNALETKGYSLFMSKYNCFNCHHVTSNTYSTEALFLDNGLDLNYTDLGRGAITHNAADNGTFKVPSLHNIALTAPYMHDGRFNTLDEVLDHYSHGINYSPNLSSSLIDPTTRQPISMSIPDDEKQAIIAFLNTFTDYNMISDPKFSNPFKVQ